VGGEVQLLSAATKDVNVRWPSCSSRFWEVRCALAHIFGRRINLNVTLPTLSGKCGQRDEVSWMRPGLRARHGVNQQARPL
jgi:hypothetical protein